MINQKKTRPMYFASLEVENVKSFGGKQTLDLRDTKGVLSPWTLILGDNGVGKTTLLKCLAWMLPVELPEDQPTEEKLNIAKQLLSKGIDLSIIEEVTGITKEKLAKSEVIKREDNAENIDRDADKVKIKPIMDNFDDESDYNSIIRVGDGVEMNIKAKLTNGLNLNSTPSEDDLITIGISLKRVGDEIQDILDTSHLTTADLEEFNSPNLFAYSAARHMAAENIEKPELKDSTFNLFSNSGDLYDAEEVLLDLYNTSVKEKLQKRIEQDENDVAETKKKESEHGSMHPNLEGKATKYLDRVKEILTELLPHIDSPDCIIVNQPINNDRSSNSKVVEIITPFGQVGLYDLSLGYQTMLAWVVDLAIRMFWQNPDNEEPLKEPAVVIVDEIDLHLHPKWQRTLKQYLTHHFPATQFICTAHSPFMAQASEDENLCVLHENKLSDAISEVRIENDPIIVKGWRIGQVATSELFGISSERKIDFENDINKRRTLIDKSRINELNEEEQKTLKELDEKLSKIPIQVEATEENLRLLSKLDNISKLLKDDPDSL